MGLLNAENTLRDYYMRTNKLEKKQLNAGYQRKARWIPYNLYKFDSSLERL